MENIENLLPSFSGGVYPSLLLGGVVFSLYDFLEDIKPFLVIEIIHLIKLNCTIYKRESHFMGDIILPQIFKILINHNYI